MKLLIVCDIINKFADAEMDEAVSAKISEFKEKHEFSTGFYCIYSQRVTPEENVELNSAVLGSEEAGIPPKCFALIGQSNMSVSFRQNLNPLEGGNPPLKQILFFVRKAVQQQGGKLKGVDVWFTSNDEVQNQAVISAFDGFEVFDGIQVNYVRLKG